MLFTLTSRRLDELIFLIMFPFVWAMTCVTCPIWGAIALWKYRTTWLEDRENGRAMSGQEAKA